MDSLSSGKSPPDVKAQMPHFKLIDEQVYCSTVLQLPHTLTEDELDEQLQQEAHRLGLLPPQVSADIQGMTSSLSATTLGSESNKQASLLSQSTATTSCSSSEHRPKKQTSIKSGESGQISQPPSIMSETERRRSSGFRFGLRNKMAELKRKKTSPTSMTLSVIKSDGIHSPESDKISIKSGMRSPISTKSSKSSWSSPVSAGKSSYDSAPPIDHEALKRSMDCPEMMNLQKLQTEEGTRLLDFERCLMTELRTRRDFIREEKSRGHRAVLNEKQAKMEQAVEDLEARQLEDEMKMQKEHQGEKRTVMTRLRHMEAYCQNPTPPPTPVDPTSGRPSLEVLPGRKVTDKDYHNLAQQYRERDAMDTLHASKINVLRGKQKKTVENLIRKKEKEIELLEHEQEKELQQIDKEFQDDNVRAAIGAKRARLDLRWQTQAMIERGKMEKLTGLKYSPLPDATTAEKATNIGTSV